MENYGGIIVAAPLSLLVPVVTRKAEKRYCWIGVK